MTFKQDLAASAVQAMPSAAVVGAHLYGLSLPDWAAVFGMAFITFQAVRMLILLPYDIRARKAAAKELP